MVRNSLDQLHLCQQAKDDGNTHAASLRLSGWTLQSTFSVLGSAGPYVHTALWREAGLQHVTGLGQQTQPKLFNARETHGKQGAACDSRGETHARPPSIFSFRTVRKIHPTVPEQSVLPCLGNRNSPLLMPFQYYLVICQLPPNLPTEPTPRGSQPQGTTYCVWPVASSFQRSLRLPYLLGILPTTPVVLLITLVKPIISLYLTVHAVC